ncbi:MAG: hypothetical protein M3R11_02540 [Acidobacteriota bacterium]|nr:hypothetical protein [Acidobacteriota bacterium]
MKNIKLTLFLALVVATTATSAFADGQIPIMGRPDSEPNKRGASAINIVTKPESEISSEISNYLWTFATILRQFKF